MKTETKCYIDGIDKSKGFVPVQYKILKLDADDIIKSDKIQVKKEKGTGTTEYFSVPEKTLMEWLVMSHGKSGLVSVGDNILFQKLREIKAELNGDENFGNITPNQQQKEAYCTLQSFRNKIKRLKREINGNTKAKKKTELLNNTIYEMEQFLFIPEIINVQSDTKGKYKKFATKGFYYGGQKFVRRSAGSGNLKQNTVTFIREDYSRAILPKIRVGFQFDVESSAILPPSKFGAYEGLNTSGGVFVTTPRVVVIPDFEYVTFKDKDDKTHKVYYVEKVSSKRDNNDDSTEYDISIVPFYETKENGAYLNSFDGMGLIEPKFIEKYWQDDLMIDYIPSAFIVRSIGVKGLLATFPFRQFAEDKGFTKILDIRYKGRDIKESDYVDIRNVDIILTESQWKYKKLYEDIRNRGSYNFDFYHIGGGTEVIWSVQRIAPKENKDISRLNYQLVQTSNLRSQDDINAVIEPTMKYLHLLAEGKKEYILYSFLKDIEMQQTDDENGVEEYCEIDYENLKTTTLNKVLRKNHELLNDAYVVNEVKKYIKSILDRAKCGKLYPEHNSNYQFMISDPYALAQWAFNWYDWTYNTTPSEEQINNIGLIPPYYTYSKYWMNKGVSKIDACRSPMTDIAEHNILTVCNSDNVDSETYAEMRKYFNYINSGIVYSIYDLSTVKHSDSDFDGDIVLTMDSNVFIKNAWDVYPTTYDKEASGKSKKGKEAKKEQIYDIKCAVNSDMQGFGNKVGVYSNFGTMLFAMMPLFNNGEKHTDPLYPEYDCTQNQLELYKSSKKNRYITGEEIDSTKTGNKPELSSDFEAFSYSRDMDRIAFFNQKEIEDYAKTLQKTNELKPQYLPYFFIYAKQYYKDKYNSYKSKMNNPCKWLTYKPIDKFISNIIHGTAKIETENEQNFYDYYMSHSPLLMTECSMNKICWALEKFESDLNSIIKKNWKDKGYVLLNHADKNTHMTKREIAFIKTKYDEYFNGIREIFNKENEENKTGSDENNLLFKLSKRNALVFDIKTALRNELGVGAKKMFDMLVVALKECKEKDDSINRFVWKVMGDDILEMIPESKEELKWSKVDKPNENSVEILGKNIIFRWEERIID